VCRRARGRGDRLPARADEAGRRRGFPGRRATLAKAVVALLVACAAVVVAPLTQIAGLTFAPSSRGDNATPDTARTDGESSAGPGEDATLGAVAGDASDGGSPVGEVGEGEGLGEVAGRVTTVSEIGKGQGSTLLGVRENGMGVGATWSCPAPLDEVAQTTLSYYRDQGGFTLAASGYLDFLTHVWGCVVSSGQGWSELVTIDERGAGSDGGCLVTIVRVGQGEVVRQAGAAEG
jgi:hypothetical protein